MRNRIIRVTLLYALLCSQEDIIVGSDGVPQRP